MQDQEQQQEQEQDGHTPKAVRICTVEAGLMHYKRTVSILKKGYEQERYRVLRICDSTLGKKLIHEVTSVDIATYRDSRLATISTKTKRVISTATVRLEMSLLSNFFDLARIEWGYTKNPNPCADVRKPKPAPGRERRVLPREERAILRYAYRHSNIEWYSIVILALVTAMRQGEILSLQWEHINFRSRVAHLPETKNGSKRDVPLSIRAIDALTRLTIKQSGPVFSYTSNGVKSTWRFMLQVLKIEDLHFHDLRHEAVSRLFELGTLDMMEIAAITGHKSLSMLKRYTHLKVNKLVHKLEGSKSKARTALLGCLVPYPAIVLRDDRGKFTVVFPDLEGEQVEEKAFCTKGEAVEYAELQLLAILIGMIRVGKQLPAPDQYLQSEYIGEVLMVNPLR